MKKRYLLGVDLGTTATKAALYEVDGALVSEGRAEVPITYPESGCAEQDSEDFYRSAAVAVRQCLAACSVSPDEIGGLAFDSQMAGVGSIDEEFRPATRFDSWLDMRCQPYIQQLDHQHADAVTSVSGCPPTCDHGPKILWWMHERPEEYRRIAKFVMPACYVAGRMTGLRADDAYIDYTFLHFTALADARRGTWSPELIQILGVDEDRLPRIVKPWEVIGEVQPDAAAEFGVAAGIPVAAGAGDTAAGALGAGVVKPGMLLDTAGTASVLACCTDRFAPDRQHRALLVMRSIVPGIWNPLAYVGGGGLTLPWFREKLAGVPAGASGGEAAAYEQLFEVARQVPAGCEGLLFSPHLTGRICPAAPAMRGAWIGFSWKHTPAHFFRAIAESIGYEYAYYLKIQRGLLPELPFKEARVIGGGAKSTAWNQMKADILGVPYRTVTLPESATWGSALVAGKAAGLIEDIGAAALAAAPVSEDVIEPDPELEATYRLTADRYIRWQEKLKEGFAEDE